MTPPKKNRFIAFYLPQFHPIPENNAWWGNGFTEWTNVAASRPRFPNHHQPQIPADLGFYDLRLAETRQAQAELASAYGIGGFCYYHYWFNGNMLLNRPFDEVMKSGDPDFPFCLCWANENWTRAWDGLDRQMLIKQDYSEQGDADRHIAWFIGAFKDARYIKIDGRPLLLIYRMDHIPKIQAMIQRWRRSVKDADFPELYLCAVKNGFIEMEDSAILKLGFDAIVDFQPNRADFPEPDSPRTFLYSFVRKFLPTSLYQALKLSVSANNIVDYRRMVEGIIRKAWPKNYRKFPCIFPSWDNSARRKSATIIQNDDPEIYGNWLRYAVNAVDAYPEQEQLVFINAWNEWAEGCHLEPDRRHGHAFLEQTRAATSQSIEKG